MPAGVVTLGTADGAEQRMSYDKEMEGSRVRRPGHTSTPGSTHVRTTPECNYILVDGCLRGAVTGDTTTVGEDPGVRG